jgi:hypothetical protein
MNDNATETAALADLTDAYGVELGRADLTPTNFETAAADAADAVARHPAAADLRAAGFRLTFFSERPVRGYVRLAGIVATHPDEYPSLHLTGVLTHAAAAALADLTPNVPTRPGVPVPFRTLIAVTV